MPFMVIPEEENCRSKRGHIPGRAEAFSLCEIEVGGGHARGGHGYGKPLRVTRVARR